ncbi:MAG: hypothetical protein VB817_00780, partial [Pirellulaceae bacterium]
SLDWTTARRAASALFPQLQQQPVHPGSYWNINFPEPADLLQDPTNWQLARLDHHPLPVTYEKHTDGYHYRCDYRQRPYAPGSDVAICFGGVTSVTELMIGS